jgi:hypothetical protein
LRKESKKKKMKSLLKTFSFKKIKFKSHVKNEMRQNIIKNIQKKEKNKLNAIKLKIKYKIFQVSLYFLGFFF